MAAAAAAAGAAEAWAGAAGADAGAIGEVSTLTASWTSEDAFRNSRMLLPSAAPTSGSLPGPRIKSAMTRMMTSSSGPGVGIVRRAPVDSGFAAARVAQGVAEPSRRRPPRHARMGRQRTPRRGPARRRRSLARCSPGVPHPAGPRPVRRPPCRARGPDLPRLPEHRHRVRGRPGPGPSPGSPPARPGPSPRRPARPSRRAPTAPPGARPGGGAARPVHRAAASAATSRSCNSPAPGLDVRHSTYANRSGRSSNGAIASAPRYGLTVTASAPRTSNRAVAWRAAVEPMSPRFASATTGRSAGRLARIRSRAAIPADPKASKNARFGLIAAATGPAASATSVANRSRPRRSRENPDGRPARSGSRPRHRTVPVADERAASRSR